MSNPILLFIFVSLFTSLFASSENSIRYKVVKGSEATLYTNDLIKLCNTVYREHPYLYDGTAVEYDEALQLYAKSEHSVLVIAFFGDTPVGMATGIPFSEYDRSHYQLPFITHGYDLKSIFYLGELVILPEYRGIGIGSQLFHFVERYANEAKRYKILALCQIEMNNGVIPEGNLWKKMGLQRHPELDMTANWRNIGEEEETEHRQVFWIKDLSN